MLRGFRAELGGSGEAQSLVPVVVPIAAGSRLNRGGWNGLDAVAMAPPRRWWIPVVLVALGAAVAALAPAERTLGDGIRWVYVHVGLVWAGTLALGVGAAGGVLLLVTGRAGLEGWVRAAGWAGLLAFALGVGFSMIAAHVNWGAVALEEPRMAASLRFLAVAAIVAVGGAGSRGRGSRRRWRSPRSRCSCGTSAGRSW